MLYTGVAWSTTGFVVESVDGDGTAVAPATLYEPGRVTDLIGDLRRLGRHVVTVVDSTNGAIDGHLMIAGLRVYRADPWQLPERSGFGSASAGVLARTAQRDLRSLTRLRISRGTPTGRERQLADGIEASSEFVAELTAAGRCVRHGTRDGKRVALTFDGGPNPPYTGEILDVLDKHQAPATFFCVGLHAGAHTGELARMRERGHAIGNLTWSHPMLPDLTRAELAEQLDRTGKVLAETAGSPPHLFRPPYGSRTPTVMRWLTELGPTVVLSDVAPDDWTMPGAAAIADAVVDNTCPGSIIQLHDGGGDRSQTVAALGPIIGRLKARGYEFVLVDDLLAGDRAETFAGG